MTTKYCSHCEEPFGCNNIGSGCWCQEHTLSAETLAELKEAYDDCLCPGCLSAYTEKGLERAKLTDKE